MDFDKTFEELIVDVQRELGDPEGIRYTDAEVREKLDEAQYETVKKAKNLHARAPITSRENDRIYNFPSDLLEPLYLEDKNGSKIEFTDSSNLEEMFGADFRSRTVSSDSTVPNYAYSDFVGRGQFEFYPKSSINITSTPVRTKGGYIRLAIGTISGETIKSLALDGAKLYLYTDTKLRVYTIDHAGKLILSRTVTLGVTLTATNIQSSLWQGFLSFTNAEAGTMYFTNTADIYFVKPKDTAATLLHTAAGTIGHILPISSRNPVTHLLWSIGTTLYFYKFSDDSDGTVGTIAVTVLDSTLSPDGSAVYICGSAGVQKIEYSVSDGSASIGATLSTNSCSTIFRQGQYVYFQDNTAGTMKRIDPSDDSITDTSISITNFSTVKEAISDDIDTFFISHAQDGTVFRNIDLEDSSDSFYSLEQSAILTDFHRSVAYNGRLYTALPGAGITVSDADSGRLVYMDGLDFNGDTGRVTDMIEGDGTVNIKAQSGIVSTIITNDEAYYVIYIRCPVKGKLEVKEYRALIEYAKWKFREEDDDAQSIAQSLTYKANYERITGEERSRSGKGYNRNTRGSKSYYI